MITKEAGLVMEKRGNLSIAAGVHVAQNIFTKRMLGNPKLTTQLGRRFVNGVRVPQVATSEGKV